MGAWLAEQIATGKTPAEAYRRAVGDAEAEYGHQEGYSGALNSKDSGFVFVELPARLTYAKFQSLLEDANDEVSTSYLRESITDDERTLAQNLCKRSVRPAIRKRIAENRRYVKQAERSAAKREETLRRFGFDASRFARLAETYYEKWDAPLCVELKGAEAKRYAASKRRGEKVYIFFGYAPS